MESRPRMVRKSMRLDQAKLGRAKEILGTSAETETVEPALEMIIFHHQINEGIRRIAGTDPDFEHVSPRIRACEVPTCRYFPTDFRPPDRDSL